MESRSALPVAVIGAGPAGLTTAILLAQKNWPVVVIDQQEPPIDKACGEGLMPPALQVLARLGPLAELQQCGRSFDGISYHVPAATFARGNSGINQTGALMAAATFLSGAGLGVRRTRLSRWLYQQARQQPLIRFEIGRADHYIRHSDHAILEYTQPQDRSNRVRLACRYVIGADGLRSTAARWIQPNQAKSRKARRNQQRWGLTVHCRGVPAPGKVMVHFSQGMEAYVTPLGSDEIGIAFLWYRSSFQPRGRSTITADLFARFEELQQSLAIDSGPLAGWLDASLQAVGPLYTRRRAITATGISLVGDAAGYVDAITGEGLNLALHSASLLADTLDRGLLLAATEGRLLNAQDLRQYTRAVNRLKFWPELLTHGALLLSRRPVLQRAFVSCMQRQPYFFSQILNVNMGLASGWQLCHWRYWPAILQLLFQVVDRLASQLSRRG
ncbi:MAG: NAD(P)/FAD-dependent oxidoreductase [Leptospiraceae bacterium]|nr:NAD(P)/FAD-dependent oxidoreductase [Leptospiraceae bacterium]